MDLAQFRLLAKNWDRFGQRDPMFGVLSDPTKFNGRWQVDEFFESGRVHVNHLFGILEAHGATWQAGRALDFGAGVGRLTQPIAERFAHTVGVDVAKSMVALARKHNAHGSRCEYVVNPHPDLRQFPSASMDFVHSCLVLQHIPPDVSPGYIAEFLRIAKPGGLVVFQVPAQVFTEAEVDARLTLPPDGYRARLEVRTFPLDLEAGAQGSVSLTVTNESAALWHQHIPSGRHLCVANHWLDEHGVPVVPDDGRARLPHDLAPGQSGEVTLTVTAPSQPGRYLLEVDLVQERIAWFAQRGSSTARVPLEVLPARPKADLPVPPAPAREGFLARIRRRLQGPEPFFEMHVVPRAVVEQTVQAAGGQVLHAVEDGAAGGGWLSYTYICRKN